MATRCIIHECDMKARVAGSLCRHHAGLTPAIKVRMLEQLDLVHELAIGGLAIDRIDAREALEAMRDEVREWWKGD